MQYWEYNEERQRGTREFPVEFHHIDSRHPRYAMPYHWHMEFELLRVLEGKFFLTLDRQEFALQAGDYAFIGGGTLHGGFPQDCVYECIVFDLRPFAHGHTACREVLEQFLSRKLLPREHYPASMTDFTGVLQGLFSAVSTGGTGSELLMQGELYRFFGLLLQNGEFHPGTQEDREPERRILQLKQALAVIENHFDRDITLDELSRAAGMSPKYFCRFFRAMTHRTPIEYLNYYRLERACYLLTATDQPITRIAMDCGFNDLSYFIRSFKKQKGITPKKYRNGLSNIDLTGAVSGTAVSAPNTAASPAVGLQTVP